MTTTTGSPRTKKTRKPRKTVTKKLPSNPFMNEQHEELLRRYEERIELWNKGYDSD